MLAPSRQGEVTTQGGIPKSIFVLRLLGFIYFYREVRCCLCLMAGLEGTKTDSFILSAKRKAEATLHEKHPKLTALERACREALIKQQKHPQR